MKLDVLERLMLPGVLPQQGNYVEQTVCRGIMKVVPLSEEEIERFGFVSDGEQHKWKSSEEVKIDLSDVAVALIKKALKKMDDEGTLTLQYLTLYEKFGVNAPVTEEKVMGKIDKKE